MEGYMAEIRYFAGTFAPRGWAFCQGQLFAISQYDALFSLLGTTYGGDGQTTFGLPDFRGRVPMGTGQGPGLSNCSLGEMIGSESVTLTTPQMAAHTHVLQGAVQTSPTADNTTPAGNFLAPAAVSMYGENGGGPNMAPNIVTGMSGPAGDSQPHDNMQPYLGMYYIICVEGIYPSRS